MKEYFKIKEEYDRILLFSLKKVVLYLLMDLYSESKKDFKGKKHLLLKHFQIHIQKTFEGERGDKEIRKFNKRVNKILKNNNTAMSELSSYYTAVIVSYSHILAGSSKIKNKIKIDTNFSDFFYNIFKNTCRHIWSHPFLLKDYDISLEKMNDNEKKIKDTIEENYFVVIRNTLPMDKLLENYTDEKEFENAMDSVFNSKYNSDEEEEVPEEYPENKIIDEDGGGEMIEEDYENESENSINENYFSNDDGDEDEESLDFSNFKMNSGFDDNDYDYDYDLETMTSKLVIPAKEVPVEEEKVL